MNREKLLGSVIEEWVDFQVHKVNGAEVVWTDYTELSDESTHSCNAYSKKMLDENAYLIKDTACFHDLGFDITDNKILTAERYGGEGITVNGGGGRCGNTEKYQLKGIGANCMVGDHDEPVHKYGGLDAPLAIIETIYTNLFCILLPLGAVKIRGLIYVGGKTAFYHHPANECWGVIMVRDHCLRPAHFMRAPHFKPLVKYKSLFADDVTRIRSINKKLFDQYEDSNQFILFLGRYLHNCANQLGFARAARVAHGALTPSNITVDGRWLDLPIASMLSGGVNYCLTSQFYTESHGPLNYAIELLHGYAKYNNTVLNPAPLVNYYNEQFDAYFRHYIGYVLGFDLEVVKMLDSEQWRVITDCFAKVIHAGKHFDNRPITRDINDPVHSLIVGLFLSLVSPSTAEAYMEVAKVEKEEFQRLLSSFNYIVLQHWNLLSREDQCSLKSYIVSTSLIALKRAYLSEVFYSPLIADTVWNLCQEKTPSDIAPLIDSYHDLAKWIFEPVRKVVTLYHSENMNVNYCQVSGVYQFETAVKTVKFFSYTELYSHLKTECYNFDINNFSFSYYFECLLKVFPLIETYKGDI